VAQWDGLLFGDWSLFLRQLEAVGITIVFAVVGTLVAVAIAKLFTKNIRVSAKEESIGLDLSEHGESAYPAFNGMDN
jgi:Amt family ammonium transporter